MSKPIPIHKLSSQTGLTSRTLRYWEAEGLFGSTRDADSGWRVYDDDAVMKIRVTALLRQLDIAVKEIKMVLNLQTYSCLRDVVNNRILALKNASRENAEKEARLTKLLSALGRQSDSALIDSDLLQLLNRMEEYIMPSVQNSGGELKFITLPPMRTVYNIAVGISPEDEATVPVLKWLEAENLTGTARLFGGNMPPMPSGAENPYGYGMCASIPETVSIPGHLKEMRLPGGLYARLESTEDIPASWKKLMRLLAEDEQYTSDRSRLCFEEHLMNDSGGFFIVLLEPVKVRGRAL